MLWEIFVNFCHNWFQNSISQCNQVHPSFLSYFSLKLYYQYHEVSFIDIYHWTISLNITRNPCIVYSRVQQIKVWPAQTPVWWNRGPYSLKIIFIKFLKKYLCAGNEFSPSNNKKLYSATLTFKFFCAHD
jgi:hypothetical protein